MSKTVDISRLHSEIDLDEEQKEKLSEAICLLLEKFSRASYDESFSNFSREYFTGVADGLNHAYKLVNGIDDDYNSED